MVVRTTGDRAEAAAAAAIADVVGAWWRRPAKQTDASDTEKTNQSQGALRLGVGSCKVKVSAQDCGSVVAPCCGCCGPGCFLLGSVLFH